MNFSNLATKRNPYAGKDNAGNWLEGEISTDFLNAHFGSYNTAQEMIDATQSAGLKLYFAWLKTNGILS